MDWFEKTSNDNFARHNSFLELECLFVSGFFNVELFKGFVNVLCCDLLFD